MITLLSQAALACGGLMCDAGPTPVVQNAERIAFLIDEQAGEVEAHVQIFYEGPPDAFAWVVPVAAAPEVFLSTAALFDQVAVTLAPQVQLLRTTEGTCRGEGNFLPAGGCNDYTLMADSDFRSDTADPGVEVVSEGQVGPYDHAVLRADGEAELVTWLQDNGYAVPTGLSAALAPYMVEGGHFVAVRLQKDRDTGDIAPLGLRYAADRASIPIQLTALATAPDLRLEVSVFGAHRAVPESYLHVAINEASIGSPTARTTTTWSPGPPIRPAGTPSRPTMPAPPTRWSACGARCPTPAPRACTTRRTSANGPTSSPGSA